MKPVAIDFSGARPARPAWVLGLCALGVALCVTAAWRLSDLTAREHLVRADIERQQSREVQVRRVAVAAPKLEPGRIAAINGAVTQLNLPWQVLFQVLEQAKPANIALLGLEPDGKRRVLRIAGEARQAADMLDFVQTLRRQDTFVGAVLLNHEVQAQDPHLPVRFLIEASWKADL